MISLRHVRLPDDDRDVRFRVADALADLIRFGHVEAGDSMPAIADVMEAFACGKNTAWRAYQILLADGLVESPFRRGGLIVSRSIRPEALKKSATQEIRAAIVRARKSGVDRATMMKLVDSAFASAND
jgi:DNA-binding transcriptional regulator YhcF (GntR family)